MRKISLIISFVFCSSLIAQTLSPISQALYNNRFNADTARGNYALSNGATFHSSPDSLSFYLQWFPNGTQPDTLPMIVTCHGSDGKVFDEFFLWHPYAVANNCGIIAIQWYNPDSTVWYNDHYLKDTSIYNTAALALNSISYPSGKALFHGFSRGSARSYAITLYDVLSGNNYFCTTMSNAGSAEPGYPLYTAINMGTYGPTPFLGKRWALYCGSADVGPTSGCTAMINTQNWLIAKGATVDVFIQEAGAPHGGFHLNSANVDSIMVYYLECFNGWVGVEENIESQISVYPNPNNGIVFIKTPANILNENCWIEIYDGIGRLAYKRPLLESIVYLHEIRSGNYAYVVFSNGSPIKKGKMLVQ